MRTRYGVMRTCLRCTHHLAAQVIFDYTCVDCHVFLAKLARDEGMGPEAFATAFRALRLVAASVPGFI